MSTKPIKMKNFGKKPIKEYESPIAALDQIIINPPENSWGRPIDFDDEKYYYVSLFECPNCGMGWKIYIEKGYTIPPKIICSDCETVQPTTKERER